MRAIRYEQFSGTVEVADVPDPAVPVDGVVVEVAASGLCRSDWHGWMGHDPAITTLPHVPGHELAGTIVAVGPGVTQWSVGARVTVPFVVACGTCRACRDGSPQVCLDQWQPGFDGWGSHAELVAIPRADRNLVHVPDELDLAVAAGLGCRVTTAWRAVVDQAAVAQGEWVAVHGCGGLGLSAILVARARGARIVAVDLDPARLEQARAAGAEVVLAADAEDLVELLREVSGGGTSVSIDAVGSEEAVANALHGLAEGGRHAQVGLLPAGSHVPMDEVIGRELRILGTHGVTAARVADVLDAVAEGALVPQHLAGDRLTLEEGAVAMVGAVGTRTAGLAVIEPAS
ncbi:alcohol dehydrogenase catalytic domain-containing protein [Salsipaludibacter albus]|uniref:alcohol dehydrogenase catalytic domain-containing protein n=1 Tax=Salsipaludibacter albus TaxID=2849650 RepID=UPI001EE40F68|nr:alcohol dehydrogenase catalytic domain-containing protein [Salsipaludibacter albus]